MLLGIVLLLSVVFSGLTCFWTGAFSNLSWLWVLPVGFVGYVLGLVVLICLLMLVASWTIDLTKPQEEDDPYYRWFIEKLIESLIPLVFVKLHVTGMEKLPKDGRFLLVCNHQSDTDPVVLLHCFAGKTLAFISKRENNQRFLVGKLMHRIMTQPINRENDREALKTILKCISILKEDKASIGVFPEGYTSMDGLLHPFRHGVFKIAQKAGVPIVVCTLRNTRCIFGNAIRLKRTHVYLNLVDVVPAEQLKGVTAVAVGERVHAMMAEDLGPDLVLQSAENT